MIDYEAILDKYMGLLCEDDDPAIVAAYGDARMTLLAALKEAVNEALEKIAQEYSRQPMEHYYSISVAEYLRSKKV